MLASACTPEREKPSAELPRLGANLKQTSLSGISSGAYMAGQYQLAHSQDVVGAGIIAGGPYGCAESTFADTMPGPGTLFINVSKAINGCMLNALQSWGIPDPQQLAGARGASPSTAASTPSPVSRPTASTCSPARRTAPSCRRSSPPRPSTRRSACRPRTSSTSRTSPRATPSSPRRAGSPAPKSGKPYVVDCDYDQAGALLRHIYGDLKPSSSEPTGELVVFDQRAFTRDLGDQGDHGFVYVPANCRDDEGCRVHVAFHGCEQSRGAIGDVFAKETGFNRWADTNRLIVLYPQTTTGALNPQSCWDWWGYTGRDYLTRNGPQIQAVSRMIERLASPRVGSCRPLRASRRILERWLLRHSPLECAGFRGRGWQECRDGSRTSLHEGDRHESDALDRAAARRRWLARRRRHRHCRQRCRDRGADPGRRDGGHAGADRRGAPVGEAVEARSAPRGLATPPTKEFMIGAYAGAPYTYPSDVTIKNGGTQDFTVKDLGWDGEPLEDPIYYGVRVALVRGRQRGAMLDFTHSKVLARMNEDAAFQGTLDGAPAPGAAASATSSASSSSRTATTC